jgi:hypothetical protein
LAALERSEQQDQQRAVAMAEEHMHFLQSASEWPPAAAAVALQQGLQRLGSMISTHHTTAGVGSATEGD